MKSSGNFRHDPKRASAAGRIGGSVSPGNFKNNPERARLAGRKGGSR
jgi:general stress protein YciG